MPEFDTYYQQTIDPFTGTPGEAEVHLKKRKKDGPPSEACGRCGQQVIRVATDQGSASAPKLVTLNPEAAIGGKWYLTGEKGRIAKATWPEDRETSALFYYEHRCSGFKDKK